jgi:hypothetical protein
MIFIPLVNTADDWRKVMTDANKTCFIIAPIGDLDSETRKRSDQIFKYVFEPAAKECGYEAIRADHIAEPGMITSQIIQHIIDDPIVIADLTGKNPNVFYELAIRHAIRKPYAQIVESGERIPFDVAGLRTIDVNHHDLDSVDFAKQELIKQIKSMQQEGSEVNSPISITLDLDILRRSEIPEKRQLADVLTAIQELKSEVISLKTDCILNIKEDMLNKNNIYEIDPITKKRIFYGKMRGSACFKSALEENKSDENEE